MMMVVVRAVFIVNTVMVSSMVTNLFIMIVMVLIIFTTTITTTMEHHHHHHHNSNNNNNNNNCNKLQKLNTERISFGSSFIGSEKKSFFVVQAVEPMMGPIIMKRKNRIQTLRSGLQQEDIIIIQQQQQQQQQLFTKQKQQIPDQDEVLLSKLQSVDDLSFSLPSLHTKKDDDRSDEDDIHHHLQQQQQRQQQERMLNNVETEFEKILSTNGNEFEKEEFSNNNNNNMKQMKTTKTKKKEGDEQQQQQSQPDKLTAIVHIGPQKTGTSAIQTFMQQHLLSLLEMDHHERVPDVNVIAAKSFTSCFYLNNNNHRYLKITPIPTTTTTIGTTNNYLNHNYNIELQKNQYTQPFRNNHHHRRTEIDYTCYNDTLTNPIPIATERHHHLIISSETLADWNINNTQLKYYLQPNWYNIKIVIYYRRFYSWIVSLHNQQNKYKNNIKDRIPLYEYINRSQQIRNMYHSYYTIGALHRYQQNYGPHPMFTEIEIPMSIATTTTTTGTTETTTFTKITKSSLHYDDIDDDNNNNPYYDDGESSTSIHLYNLHDPHVSTSLMEHFFCTALNTATNTCEETHRMAQDGTLNHSVNPTIPFIYEDLVYYAIQYGYIRTTYNDISYLIQLTQQRQESILGLKSYEFDSFAVTCPNRTALDMLLQLSHIAEEEVYPRTYHVQDVGGKDVINQDFQIAIETNKFCSINASQILLEGDTNQWKEFFQSL